MTKCILGMVMALLLLGGPVAAECTYQGVVYSEGARVCMYRTLYMCKGERWVKTAERCWERYFTRASGTRGAAYRFGLAELAVIQHPENLAKQEQEKPATQ
ncbi:MAG: hypothetical protein HY268_25905 [Deltaproteobacteria bacterium]|nr:hypothetical protein [Deltaproteobacteria bacterium]